MEKPNSLSWGFRPKSYSSGRHNVVPSDPNELSDFVDQLAAQADMSPLPVGEILLRTVAKHGAVPWWYKSLLAAAFTLSRAPGGADYGLRLVGKALVMGSAAIRNELRKEEDSES